MEASALAEQVENIARSLSPNPSQPDSVTPEHRKLALSTLVELKRLEQLKAIAESKSNSTYFFGDKAALGMNGNMEAFNVDYAQSVKAGINEGSGNGRGRAEGALLTN